MFKITLLYESIKVTQRLPKVDMTTHAAQVIATAQQTVAARYNIDHKTMQLAHAAAAAYLFIATRP